jgi:hypothetical protein
MPNYGIPQEMFFTTLKEEEREREGSTAKEMDQFV